MKCRLIEDQRDTFKVRAMCDVLGVSPAGYYAWRGRPESHRKADNRALLAEIRRVHAAHRGRYGAPRVHATLRAEGHTASRSRVERLMRHHGIRPRMRRQLRVRTTDSRHDLPIAPNLLEQTFVATRPNWVWLADITYVPTAEGWLYLAVVLDLFTRKIVGWAMRDHRRAGRVIPMISPDPDDVTPVRLAEIKEAFNAALDQPAETRDVFLRERYPADIAAEVRALLAAYARADTFLERPALLDTAAAGALEDVLPVAGAELLPIGTHLGPYVITAHLGEGGMGHVFRARRDDQSFDQQVAIKVVRADIATSTMVERLRQERRILAALDHPNIARLVDGGSTDAGLPYAVMELVEGVPIDQYAESHALDLPSRRQLFRTVCGAVQYAHERLVVHRDLKPSNILVTANGTPKLLDFGISKILTPDQTDIARTRTGWWALTPRYASPEQIRGEAVSVASDVYALGVLAYELFTRVSPYGKVTTESRTALEHAILESDPPPPSRVAPPALQRALRGDLDRIVMKALEKPLARRYANVEQLCDDLDNYARGRPVSVGPDAWTYRARKFVQRHRLGVTAAVTALAALTAGFINAGDSRPAHLPRRALETG
jgi:serine/threonine-protein kinase